MLIELLTSEILANPAWKGFTNYEVTCSKMFKETLDQNLRKTTLQVGNMLGFDEKMLKQLKFEKLTLPHGFTLHFRILDEITGYFITPKLKEE